MAKMFQECDDENGVGISHNAHPEQEYEHKASDFREQSPRYRYEEGKGYTEDRTQEPITRRTMERVYSRPSAMIFEGDLKPRGERMAGKERE
jgi:hypothetical protein